MNIADHTILITGGTRGIGKELALQLAAKGAKVIITGRSLAGLKSAAAIYPQNISHYQADLCQSAELDALLSWLQKTHPNLSLLINNAASQTEMDFFADLKQNWRPHCCAEINLNLTAAISLSLALLPVFCAHSSAAIVNISSGLALAPKQSAPVYCATKAGLRSFSKALRYQCAANAPSIKIVEAIMPLVDTDMTRGRGAYKISPAQAAARIIAGIETGRGEIWVGKTKALKLLNRLSPPLAERILR